MNKNFYAILMAGGVGSRFWPVSTREFPKQFHDMLGTGQTLLQTTFGRLNRFIPQDNILILTNQDYKGLVLEQLPGIAPDQVVLEPAMRNTAPCVLYAAMKIRKANPNALMIVAPSDHWIEDEDQFAENVTRAFDYCAENDVLMTLGIEPAFPNTGYGYIEYDKGLEAAIKPVFRFTEKPDYETAKSFIRQGNYLWNAGIFIWSADSVIKAFENHQAELYELFKAGEPTYNSEEESRFIEENYARAENISIDYAIMEKSDNVFVLPAEFDWNDLGTWGSLYDKLQKDGHGNAILNAKSLAENAGGNIIRSSKDKLVIIDGLNDYIIVENDKVLLIYPKRKEQDIKEVLQRIKTKFGENYG